MRHLLISTLIAATAVSDLVQGSTVSARIANAVALLSGLGLIDGEWRAGSPLRVNYPVTSAVGAAGGLQNW